MSRVPQYAYLVSNTASQLHHSSRAAIYRSFLQHIRLIRDPHLWSALIPPFRKACKQLSHHDELADNKDVPQDDSEGVEWTPERKAAALRESRKERSKKTLRKVG